VRVLRSLSESATAAAAEGRVRGLVTVHREGPWLRLYATSYGSLARAQDAVLATLDESRMKVEERPERFDVDRGEWTPVELPLLPETAADRVQLNHGQRQWGAAAEPDRLTIHFECGRRDKAAELADTLTERGYETHRHWTYVYLFVEGRDEAEALIETLGKDIPGKAHMFAMGDGPGHFFV
jgi:hypothetical protein